MTPAISSRAGLAHVLALEDLVAVRVDDPALLVHDVVVLEHALADEEVLLLDLLLGLLDLLGQHPASMGSSWPSSSGSPRRSRIL